jgi:hypothetical protein
VRVEASGFAATTVVAQVLESQTNEITAVLVPLPEPTAPVAEESSVVTSWWLWTIVGVVVAGGAVTAGVLLAPSGERAAADYTAWMR